MGMIVINPPKDPRLYQIAVLGLLVSYGVFVLDFGIHWYNALAIGATALSVQWAGTRLATLPSFVSRPCLLPVAGSLSQA